MSTSKSVKVKLLAQQFMHIYPSKSCSNTIDRLTAQLCYSNRLALERRFWGGRLQSLLKKGSLHRSFSSFKVQLSKVNAG